MNNLETKKPVFYFLFLAVLFCFAAPCLAQTKDYWLKGTLQSTGQAFGNIHFTIRNLPDDTIEYKVDVLVKDYKSEISQKGTYLVDSNFTPISFDIRFSSAAKNMTIKGTCSNGFMVITSRDQDSKVDIQKIPFQDTYFDVTLVDLILKNDINDASIKVKVFDPTGLISQSAPGTIHEMQCNITNADDDKMEAAVVNGVTTKKYVIDRRGTIEQFVFVEHGIRFRATDPFDAQSISNRKFSEMGIRIKKKFPNAAGTNIAMAHIRLTWKNLPIKPFCFEDNRQLLIKKISNDNGHEVTLEFTKANIPSVKNVSPDISEQFKMFMEDSGFIKPDAPIVRRRLNEIRGDEEKPHAIVSSLLKWIPRNIKFDLGAAVMMSAPEILEKRIGVCTHHSILFASLARAAGLPTKMVTGYVNLKADPHRWAVHMWNEVWLGQWVAVDPTRGVFITGPSHIKFAEAPSSRELRGVINRLENNLTLEILDFSR